MGKNTNFTSMNDLFEEKRKLEKKMAKISIPCSHTNSKGKLKVDIIKGNLVRCKNCGCKFEFDTIDSDELRDAITTIHNVINQTKALTDDPERDKTIIKTLGDIDYNLSQLEELYNRTSNKYSKSGKKNKNKNNDSFGRYGVGAIDFIETKKRGRF